MCTSLEFNELFGSSFDVPCFVFSSFVVQFSRYRSLPLFATAYLVYHTQFRLSRGFLNFFSSFFSTFSSAQSHNFLLLLAHSLSPLPLGHRLPCGALLYYHFLLLLSTPFLSFFRLFFLFFTLSFRRFELFIPFSSVFWGFVGFCRKGWLRCDDSRFANLGTFLKEKSTRKVLPRQGQTSCLSGSSRKGNGFILFASAKRTKKQPGLRPATSVQSSTEECFL